MAKTGVIDIKNDKGPARIKTAARTTANVKTRNSSPYRKVKEEIPLRKDPAANYIPKKDFIDNHDLPLRYNTTSLMLIPRDTHWIHAYWEIAPPSIESLRNKISTEFEKIAYTLRMYDVTCVRFNGNNANRWFDLDFNPGVTSNWYVNLWCDNVTYCGEIGARLPDGRFLPMTRSNTITTPRKSQSRRSEEIWMKVDDDSSGAPFVIADLRTERGAKSSGNKEPVASNTRRRKIYLSDDDIRAYYTKLSPLLRNILSQRLAKLCASNGYSLILRDGKAALDEILRRGLAKGQFMKRLLLGASEELLLVGGASEFGASENSAREEIKRKFFFEIGTELIVYGRTEPDAAVSLGNKNVPLRRDGTFTMRFALPDGGKIPLDFTARSINKIDTRKIETAVDRKFTKYE